MSDLSGRIFESVPNVCTADPRTVRELHAHLPRLDWPRDYQPFCTWLALSHHGQGYLAGPQLNGGVHSSYVAVRLGWDTSQAPFGRFEFLCCGIAHQFKDFCGVLVFVKILGLA